MTTRRILPCLGAVIGLLLASSSGQAAPMVMGSAIVTDGGITMTGTDPLIAQQIRAGQIVFDAGTTNAIFMEQKRLCLGRDDTDVNCGTRIDAPVGGDIRFRTDAGNLRMTIGDSNILISGDPIRMTTGAELRLVGDNSGTNEVSSRQTAPPTSTAPAWIFQLLAPYSNTPVGIIGAQGPDAGLMWMADNARQTWADNFCPWDAGTCWTGQSVTSTGTGTGAFGASCVTVPCATLTGFLGAWKQTTGGGKFRNITCEAGTAGSGGTTGFVMKIRNITDSTDLCTCTVSTCAGLTTPSACDCNGTITPGKIYEPFTAATTDCVTNPGNIVCNTEITP